MNASGIRYPGSVRWVLKRGQFCLAVLLVLLVCATMGAGIYFKQTFVVFVFGVWLCVEYLLHLLQGETRARGPLQSLEIQSLIELFEKQDKESRELLDEKINQLLLEGEINPYERRLVERLRQLSDLRGFVFHAKKGRCFLREAFVFTRRVEEIIDSGAFETEQSPQGGSYAIQDITESATVVADLYWKLYECSKGTHPELTVISRELFFRIFDEPFDIDAARILIERLTDCMQRDRGLPFLILNLIRKGEWKSARRLTMELLREYEAVEMDEEIRSSLYWTSEIHWFARENKALLADHESCIRYLYHLCFTTPDRAGFLEIDSQFFSQFEFVNELAQEGFLFKETLIEKILGLWKEQEGYFDGVFVDVLATMTQQKSKIYDKMENWERFWRRERENFSKEYLYVVEGNLSYSAGRFEDARVCYERALEFDPRLRPASLNLLFCYARLKQTHAHDALAERILQDKSLFPGSLYVIGDSWLLVGDKEKADIYYNELIKFEGWEKKADYYKSTFCFEHGLHQQALDYAKKAHDQNPQDKKVSYHLSVCYNAVGEKGRALDMVREFGEAPQWLAFYRFTLERDVGDDLEASRTLLRLPLDYFQDEEEFEAAIEFAKSRKDLTLLRHLKRK